MVSGAGDGVGPLPRRRRELIGAAFRTLALVGYYLDDDSDPIEYDDTPDDDSDMDLQPDFWTGPDE